MVLRKTRHGHRRQEGDAHHQRRLGDQLHPRRGKIGVLVEVNCESDFVARTAEFQELVHDIAMHIAAVDPRYIRKEDVTAEATGEGKGHLSARRRPRPASRLR